MKKQSMKIFIAIVVFGIILGCSDKDTTSIDNTIESPDRTSLTFRGFMYNIIEAGGHYWLDRNLGASTACKDYKGDTECWGDLYQWGRLADGHQKRDSNTKSEISLDAQPDHEDFIVVEIKENDIVKAAPQIATANWYITHDNNLWRADGTGVNEVCPAGWRIPTLQDFKDLNITKPIDAFHKIKLTLNGFKTGTERKYNDGGIARGTSHMGFYWTSTTWKKDYKSKRAGVFQIDITNKPFFSSEAKVYGCAVRCIKD